MQSEGRINDEYATHKQSLKEKNTGENICLYEHIWRFDISSPDHYWKLSCQHWLLKIVPGC